MRRIALLLVAATSLGGAATRPRYGGTLRVQMRASVMTLDPAAEDRLAELVFDRLVRVNDGGELRPSLAVSWESDSEHKRWQFRLRTGVRFHDGSALTPAAAAAALERFHATAKEDAIVIHMEQPAPLLPFELARVAASIARRSGDGGPVGTGPFRVREWQAGQRAVLAANEDYWGGRPFVDAVEIEMGRAQRDQVLDLELNKADIVEAGAGESRRLSQSGRRIWASSPVELLAIEFDPPLATPEAAPLREALSLAIDRVAIQNVLLQRQGTPAGSLVPEWLSGYAFLFPANRDLDRARQIAPRTAQLALSYNPADQTARAIAERIAVNAREAGLAVRAVGGTVAAGARLVRVPVGAPHPAQSLAEAARLLGLADRLAWPVSPEAQYNLERGLLEGYRVIPLVHLPEVFAFSNRLKGWSAPRWGGWRLEDVWLGDDKP